MIFKARGALARPTWPAHYLPKQMHHDFRVPGIEELRRQRQRSEELGATCCTTALTKMSRCMCSLTPPDTPFAFSSRRDEQLMATRVACLRASSRHVSTEASRSSITRPGLLGLGVLAEQNPEDVPNPA